MLVGQSREVGAHEASSRDLFSPLMSGLLLYLRASFS